MTVSMGMLIFAGLGYALEKDEPDTMFYTLPQTLYWAIITMTSTGSDAKRLQVLTKQGGTSPIYLIQSFSSCIYSSCKVPT